MLLWNRKSPAISSVIIVILALSAQAAARWSDAFNDKSYRIDVTSPDGAVRDRELTLVFKGGKFSVREWETRGFAPVGYEEDTRRGGVGSFKAEITSDKDGAAIWTGTVTGPQIKGELTWTRADGSTATALYTGERLPQKK